MKNKKGFTLIELLAVIIILGVLMLIAIPSVTEYIASSRKNSFAVTARQYISSVRNKVNSLDYSFLDPDVTYYVSIKCVRLETGGDSPFGDWDAAYVGVVYNGDSYNYYFMGKDKSNMGINLTKENDLDKSEVTTIEELIFTDITINGRSSISVMDDSCDKDNLVAYAPGRELLDNGEIIDFGGGGPVGPTEQTQLLSSVAQIGDYVLYDAGNWPSTVTIPSNPAMSFGGVTAGASKNSSVACFGSGENGTNNKMDNGWRVLKIEGGTVYIIHAGSGECFNMYNHASTGNLVNAPYNAESVLGSVVKGPLRGDLPSTLRNPTSVYGNGFMASNATIFTKEMYDQFIAANSTNQNNSMLKTNLYYYLASSYNESNLWYVQHNGSVSNTNTGSRGIRPVVTLWSCANTSGKELDAYGHEAWTLRTCNPV